MSETERFALRAIAAWLEANPGDPDVVAFKKALADLRECEPPS